MSTPDISEGARRKLLGYERVQPIHSHVICLPGEMVMQRRPFRWLLNGEVMSNCYESFEPEGFIAEKGLKIVQKISDDIYIVRAISALDSAHPAPMEGGDLLRDIQELVYRQNQRLSAEPSSDRPLHQFELEQAQELFDFFAPRLAEKTRELTNAEGHAMQLQHQLDEKTREVEELQAELDLWTDGKTLAGVNVVVCSLRAQLHKANELLGEAVESLAHEIRMREDRAGVASCIDRNDTAECAVAKFRAHLNQQTK